MIKDLLVVGDPLVVLLDSVHELIDDLGLLIYILFVKGVDEGFQVALL